MIPLSRSLQALTDAGLLIQMTGAGVLWLLFHIIRKQGTSRLYFRLWTTSWGFFALAYLALAIRYRLIAGPTLGEYLANDRHPLVLSLYITYQVSKLFGVGLLFSFVSAWLCVRWLLRYISSHTFVPFAWYRIAFWVIVLVTAWTGWVDWAG